MRTEEEIQAEFAQPKEINDVTMAFPANVVGDLLPHRGELPDEFNRYHNNAWCKIAMTWFYSGLTKETVFKMKDGVDQDLALRHLGTCLRSFEPSHEEKMGGVGFLMSLWFESIKIPKETADA